MPAGNLKHSPGHVVARLLAFLGVGTVPASPVQAWPAYVESTPTSPDNLITVYTTTGTSDGRSATDGEGFQHYGFMVRVRSSDHQTGWERADSIQRALERMLDVTVYIGSSAYFVHTIARIGDVIPVGAEEGSNRRLFTLNGTITIRQVA